MKRVYLFLGLILLLGLALRVFVASDGYLHEWDERYHALVAKNMMEEPFAPKLYKETPLPYDYRNWTENHIWGAQAALAALVHGLEYEGFGYKRMGFAIAKCLVIYLGHLFDLLDWKRAFGDKSRAVGCFFSCHQWFGHRNHRR